MESILISSQQEHPISPLQIAMQRELDAQHILDAKGNPMKIEQCIEMPKETLEKISEIEQQLSLFDLKGNELFIEEMIKYWKNPIIVYSMHTDMKYILDKYGNRLKELSKNSENTDNQKKYDELWKMYHYNKLKKNRFLNLPAQFEYISDDFPGVFSQKTENLVEQIKLMTKEQDGRSVIYDGLEIEEKILMTKTVDKFIESFLAELAEKGPHAKS